MRTAAVIILALSFWKTVITVPQARDAYFRSTGSKSDALKFEQLLDTVREDAIPVLVCYKGAAEMLKAKNAVNPVNKLACFNRGKKLIEKAIARDTSAIECRFIRYTIQDNLPGFLNYKNNIASDKYLLDRALDTLSDRDLKNKILTYLKNPKGGRKAD